MLTLTKAGLDVRPYRPDACDLCGRCGQAKFPIVGSHHYVSGWVINLCEGCLTPEEKATLNEAIDEGLYRCGLR